MNPKTRAPVDPADTSAGGVSVRDRGKSSSIDASTPASFAAAAGEVLRQVRLGRSLSLRQVTVRSGGRFKPSSIASYERGERQISLERLFALVDVYEVAPERIVAAIAHRLARDGEDPATEPVLVIDPLGLGRTNPR